MLLIPYYPHFKRLTPMIHIYLYKIFIPVKSPVKAVGEVWMTAIKKLGIPRIFPYFFKALN